MRVELKYVEGETSDSRSERSKRTRGLCGPREGGLLDLCTTRETFFVKRGMNRCQCQIYSQRFSPQGVRKGDFICREQKKGKYRV